MLWNRLVPFCAALAVLVCGCSSPSSPPDPSRVPASFALVGSDFPEGYEFHDDRDLRSLDAVELGPQSKDPRLFDYSKLTLDHLATEQPGCAALVGLGSRPTYRSAAGPALPASSESRSSLGFDKRSSTTLAFTVTRDPVPLGRYRDALAGCTQFAVTSEKIGTGQGAITPMDAPVGGLAYGLEAQLQSPSGIGYTFSRALIAAPVGNTTVLGVLSRTSSAEGGKAPLDQATLRALFQKLADKVNKS